MKNAAKNKFTQSVGKEPGRAHSTAGGLSQSIGEEWPEDDLCFCKQCRVARHEFTLTENSGDEEEVASFRASPKFGDEGELEEFLREHSLQSLHPVLKEHEVTLRDLYLLTRDDLADMKIPIGPRNRLLNVLQRSQSSSLRQSKVEISAAPSQHDPELDSPKQHSAPSVKPATPEKPPQGLSLSPGDSDNPVLQHRKALNHEVENFLQEVEDLFAKSQRRKQVTVEAKPRSPQKELISRDQEALLKELFSGRETLEKGLESLQRSIAELKDNRSISPHHGENKGMASSPKSKGKQVAGSRVTKAV